MATVEELERRVEQIEEQLRHVLPAKIDAVRYGLSLVHEDLRAVRQELTEFREETQAGIAEILRRLPEPDAGD